MICSTVTLWGVVMLRNAVAALVLACGMLLPQDPGAARTYLVKLSVPVSTKESKRGDEVRAAIVSPESLLNGYLTGVVEQVGRGEMVVRFTSVLYKGATTPIQSEVVDFVNSKGHKGVDDHERPIQLDQGKFSSASPHLWLDEGAELRVRAEPAR
jgi:hypothetical protein